jgi:hypothetical protein
VAGKSSISHIATEGSSSHWIPSGRQRVLLHILKPLTKGVIDRARHPG